MGKVIFVPRIHWPARVIAEREENKKEEETSARPLPLSPSHLDGSVNVY